MKKQYKVVDKVKRKVKVCGNCEEVQNGSEWFAPNQNLEFVQ